MEQALQCSYPESTGVGRVPSVQPTMESQSTRGTQLGPAGSLDLVKLLQMALLLLAQL